MANRFRYSLASILWLVVLAAVLFGAIRSFPTALSDTHFSLFAALLNEAAFLAISLAIVTVVGSRTRYDFALGFAVFAATTWLFDRPLPPNLSREESTWHSAVIFYWMEQALADGLFDVDFLGFGVIWRPDHLNSFLRAAETLLFGVGGGFYAMWLARRLRNRGATAEQPIQG